MFWEEEIMESSEWILNTFYVFVVLVGLLGFSALMVLIINIGKGCYMNDIESGLLKVATDIAPNSPGVEVVAAIAQTAANPNPETILADIELAISLVKQYKLNNLHPSAKDIFKLLF